MAKTNSTPPHPAKAEERNKYQAKANNDSKDTLGTILWWWLPTYWVRGHLLHIWKLDKSTLHSDHRIPCQPCPNL